MQKFSRRTRRISLETTPTPSPSVHSEAFLAASTEPQAPAATRRELREREAAAYRHRPGFRTGQPKVQAVATESAARPPRAMSMRRRIVSNFVSVSAMAGVGLIVVATTVPANAFVRPDAVGADSSVSAEAQAGSTQEFTVAAAAAPTVTRDAYTAVSLQQQVAAQAGGLLFSYTNNPSGSIQWPFPAGSPITSGFGPRKVAGCSFCSTNHKGLDFTPGSGTPIHVVADGVVKLVQVSNSGLGNHVIVEHSINGKKVETVYAHMLYGSIKVATGQAVGVGTVLGNVGSTGNSTGAHLHFETHLNGTPVDPFAWLQANAN